VLVLLTAGCLGCQSGAYTAASLPGQFEAPYFATTRTANLTRLAQARPNREQIFAGDVLEVAISTGLETRGAIRWTERVAEDGAVSIPLVGPVHVAGLILPQAEAAIRETSVSRGIYRSPQVAVQIAERRSIQVHIEGEVTRPGVYDLPLAQADLLAAIAAAGGLRSATAGELIEISHPAAAYPVQQAGYPGEVLPPPGDRHVTVNLSDLATGNPGDVHLENGSVIVVGKVPPRTFSVIGLVNKPNQYDGLNEGDIRLLDAIAMAGGRKMEIADKVRIYRRVEGREAPIIIDASIREAKSGGPGNLRLAPGDVVSVEETALTMAYGAFKSFARLTVGATARVPVF
jgi:polysaccharide export outer membrane protein